MCPPQSRRLPQLNGESVRRVRKVNRELVLEPLASMTLSRLTLDFDGSVLDTARLAEAEAVGFDKKKRSQRSYYAPFCTICADGAGIKCRSSARDCA
jgi:hypothetical protein